MPIKGDRFVIGKRDSCDLVIDDELVSREHCEIIPHSKGKYLLRDRDSRNGTFVDGQRVGSDVLLSDGMKIRVGNVEIEFLGDSVKGGRTEAPEGQRSKSEDTGKKAEGAGRRAWQQARPTPVDLKRTIHNELLNRLDLKHEDFDDQSSEEIRGKTVAVAQQIVSEVSDQIPAYLTKDKVVKEIVDEALGLGPLEDLLADPEVDEIMVNGWDRVYVERHGKIEKTNLRFTDNVQVVNIIRRIVAPIGRRIDESTPMVDARLPDGSRVNAIIAPLALTGPTLTIRKFAEEPFRIDNLISFGTLTRQMSKFIAMSVQNRQNILISGGTGSGKTTLLNVVSCNIPGRERIVTIEDAAELNLPQEHVVSLEAKPPNIRGKGAIPIRELVINSLRMRPDRIIVGECRGGEALDMLQAMNTGHDGSLTTLHANSPRDSMSRLETMVLMAGMELPSKAIRDQIASAINLVIHTARLSDGSRKVMEIQEVTGIESDTITMQSIYAFRQRGYDEEGKVRGFFTATGNVPEFVQELRERHIDVDMTLFEPSEEENEERAEKRR
ncbi:MAG: Flp pilus assembly complex ATPase component TadA [Planctomycetes bacterium]|nr:Flp pilus assembly complex ATPase component TadA [Planctomycetota bacterium]